MLKKPSIDLINIPALERFESPENYYTTLFHELIHATSHSSRLDRSEVMGKINYAIESYSKEKIVAAMGGFNPLFSCSN